MNSLFYNPLNSVAITFNFKTMRLIIESNNICYGSSVEYPELFYKQARLRVSGREEFF